jgi:hypothetical protein
MVRSPLSGGLNPCLRVNGFNKIEFGRQAPRQVNGTCSMVIVLRHCYPLSGMEGITAKNR